MRYGRILLVMALVVFLVLALTAAVGPVKPVEMICRAAGYQKVIYVGEQPFCYSFVEVDRDEIPATFLE